MKEVNEAVTPKKRVYTRRMSALPMSPEVNPLHDGDGALVPLKKKRVRSALAEKPLADTRTGEVVATSVIHMVEEKDDTEFVKVFAAGITASYELSKTAQRVFLAVLEAYEKSPMNGGFIESVYLAWFDGGLSGQKIGMSEPTFNRGLWELIEKKFLAPRSPNVFWVNPALFFKGDRVMLVKEYRRKKRLSAAQERFEQEQLEKASR